MSRSEIDGYTQFVGIYGAKGLAYIKVNDLAKGRDGLQSPIVKNLNDAALKEVLDRSQAQTGDIIFFGADKAKVVNDAIGALRVKIGHSEYGKKLGLLKAGWHPLWVIDFPMFEYDEAEQRFTAAHHPFTSPKDGHEDWLETDPSRCIAKAYDMVLNGWEIGGGSVRIHRAEVQKQGIYGAQDRCRGSQSQVRLPARRAAIRCASSRRHCLWPRPDRHHDDWG